jgi:O-antigen/teichoic acid export membrane protein
VSEALEPNPPEDGDIAFPIKFRRNVLANYANMLALLLVALLTTPLLAHGLGPQRFGIWAMVGAIIPYLEILELGFASTTVAMLARHIGGEDHDRVHAIFNTSLFVLIIPGVLCFGVACGIAAVLPHILTIEPSQVRETQILILLLGFDMAVSIPGDTFGGGLIAMQRFDLLNASLAAVTLLQALCWFLVIHFGGGLVALGIVTVGVSLLGQVSRFVMFKRLMPEMKVTAKGFDRQLARSFTRLSGWFSAAQIVMLAVDTVDVVIVGAVVGVSEAGVYAVGQRLSMLAGNMVTPVTAVFAPASAQTVGRGDTSKLRSLVMTGNRVAMGVAVPAALVTAVLARPALRAWVGPLYVAAAPVVVLLCATVVVRASTQTSRNVLAGAAEPESATVIAALSLVVHVGLAVLLGRSHGIVGVAWAVFIPSLIFEGIGMMILTSRRYHVTTTRYLAELFRAHVLPVICAGAVGLYLAHGPLWDFVRTNHRAIGILMVILSGLAMLAVYFSIFALTGLSRPERAVALRKVRASLPWT